MMTRDDFDARLVRMSDDLAVLHLSQLTLFQASSLYFRMFGGFMMAKWHNDIAAPGHD